MFDPNEQIDCQESDGPEFPDGPVSEGYEPGFDQRQMDEGGFGGELDEYSWGAQ
jgi:hypothetical protein